MAALCRALPKAELHAHLHGCVRLPTVASLAPRGVDVRCLLAPHAADRSLASCFAVFAAIHATVTTLAALRRLALEVLEDFAADGVAYLELRSTPRALQDADAAGYIACVLRAFADFEAAQLAARARLPLTPRLILSVDRSASAREAEETARLAVRLAGETAYVVGLDFSGNPTRGRFAEFTRAFEEARRAGLRTTVHTAEVEDAADTDAILAFRPDRLGHALTLTPTQLARLRAAPIPIELCPTSNKKTLGLANLTCHPTLRTLLEDDYPISISTDDSTVFQTTSSRELQLVAEACGLSAEAVAALALKPMDHVFERDAQRVESLKAHFRRAAAEALGEYHRSVQSWW
ncbi:hypothetical protein AB1Y20_008506 [Prymnesium parvum]|uniref:Adenosine deaminase domain-containing protein n=1 Tax=Prymnesium parvum TaxID=97485 RepID=A0AB34IU26_PRYPA